MGEPRPIDEIQQDATELVKAFLRTELGKDHYHGQVQAVIVLTNKVTGRMNIDSCNAPLVQDQRKMVYEALRTIDDMRLASAVVSMLPRQMVKLEVKK